MIAVASDLIEQLVDLPGARIEKVGGEMHWIHKPAIDIGYLSLQPLVEACEASQSMSVLPHWRMDIFNDENGLIIRPLNHRKALSAEDFDRTNEPLEQVCNNFARMAAPLLSRFSLHSVDIEIANDTARVKGPFGTTEAPHIDNSSDNEEARSDIRLVLAHPRNTIQLTKFMTPAHRTSEIVRRNDNFVIAPERVKDIPETDWYTEEDLVRAISKAGTVHKKPHRIFIEPEQIPDGRKGQLRAFLYADFSLIRPKRLFSF